MKTGITAISKINLFINIYINLFANIFRVALWLPFLTLAVFQAGVLLILAQVNSPVWSQLALPVLKIFLSENIFHYPQYHLVLPSIYSAIENFVLSSTVGLIMTASAVYILGYAYSNQQTYFKDGILAAIKSFLPLFVFWLIEIIIVLLILLIPSGVIKLIVGNSPKAVTAFEFVRQLLAFGVSAFLIYTIPGIIIARKKVGTALKDSINFCYHNFFLTYFIVIIPGCFAFFPDFILSNYIFTIIRLFNPQVIVVILYIKIVAGILVNLFIFGAATYVYKELFYDN